MLDAAEVTGPSWNAKETPMAKGNKAPAKNVKKPKKSKAAKGKK
jgi:hypothetical protein